MKDTDKPADRTRGQGQQMPDRGSERTSSEVSLEQEKTDWFVYMVRCNDDSLYTGITTDTARRLSEHNESVRGARYTRSRRPVSLVYSKRVDDRSAAARAEWQIKQMDRAGKERLIQTLAAVTIDRQSRQQTDPASP